MDPGPGSAFVDMTVKVASRARQSRMCDVAIYENLVNEAHSA